MSRLRLLLGLLPAIPIATSCSSSAKVPLDLVMEEPQGLLEEATSVELAVFDASVATCEATGAPSRIPTSAQRFSLQNTGCSGGAAWCTTITLDRDGSDKMFAVVARSAAGLLAQGCTTAKIDQDPLVVSIQVLRYVAPACCNDGIVEAGEECDTGIVAPTTCSGATGGTCKGISADAVCGCDCTANEILLSIDEPGNVDPRLTNGPAGSKTNLALAFGVGGTTYPDALLGLFVNSDPLTDTSGPDINARFLQQDLYPITAPAPLALQLTMPLSCGNLESNGTPGHQGSPRLALVGSSMAAVYASDGQVGGTFDVVLNPLDSAGCAPDTQCTSGASCPTGVCDATCGSAQRCCTPSVPVNSMGSVPGITSPDIAAGPPDAALIVWSYQNAIYGRIWHTDGTFPSGPMQLVSNASNTSYPTVRTAGSPSGWVVAYHGAGAGDGDGIFFLTVSATGVPGPATLVNTVTQGTQDQPAIAALPDGRVLIAWRSGGNIFFQRFDATGKPVAGDQDAPLNAPATGGALLNPTVGAGPDFFAVAWETAAADIDARFVGGSTGFGYNTVSGQNDAFQATSPAITGLRHNPSVAVGSFVAIGWEDGSAAHPGVYVRRFPLPTF